MRQVFRQPKKDHRSGFTLVELIVSLGLFTFAITMSVGALLVLIAANQQEQASQSVMTNLSFALDSMSREIRTGRAYVCDTFGANGVAGAFADQDNSLPSGAQDCPVGSQGGSDKNTAISFIEGGSSITGPSNASRIAYIIDLDNAQTIYRRVGNSSNLERIVSSGVRITDGEFMVSDNDPLSAGDTVQPTVTIYLEAEDATGGTSQAFHVQTTVTQRELDL